MKYIVIFDFLVTLSIVGYLAHRHWPFWVDVNKTFWYEVPYSITLYIITKGNRKTSFRSSKSIFTIRLRNQDKMEEWDSKMFRNGEYKNHRNNKKK